MVNAPDCGSGMCGFDSHRSPHIIMIEIHAYKHNAKLYRLWKKVFLVSEQKDYFFLYFKKSLVLGEGGKWWITQNDMIGVFSKTDWFNFTVTFKNDLFDRIYCNIASPSIFEDGVIKYIDYDLDVKKVNAKKPILLDYNEMISHAKIFGYSEKLVEIITQKSQWCFNQIDKETGIFQIGKLKKIMKEYQNKN